MRIKKCQPGFICLDNVAVFLLLVAFAGICYYMSLSNKQENINVNVDVDTQPSQAGYFGGLLPSFPYNNLPMTMGSTFGLGLGNSLVSDPLLNPYNPPLRDERYFVGGAGSTVPLGTVPINVATSSVNTAYRQVGILTPLNETSKDNILPLMGRPLFTSRSKWQYYSISNQHNNVKLPILVKQKNGLNEYGVDEIYAGDTVLVEGTDQTYKVTKYEESTIQYLPFL